MQNNQIRIRIDDRMKSDFLNLASEKGQTMSAMIKGFLRKEIESNE